MKSLKDEYDELRLGRIWGTWGAPHGLDYKYRIYESIAFNKGKSTKSILSGMYRALSVLNSLLGSVRTSSELKEPPSGGFWQSLWV